MGERHMVMESDMQRHLHVVPPYIEQDLFPTEPEVIIPDEGYVLVDSIPAFAEARSEARVAAEAILARRRMQKQNGNEAQNPLPIDALSTADYVVKSLQQHGPDSQQHQEAYGALFQDSLRYLGEAYRRVKPEYFDALTHTYDKDTDDYYYRGLSISSMMESGIASMDDDPEDEARRVNDYVENATASIVHNIGQTATEKVVIRTISLCTDKAIEDYAADQKAKRRYQGYKGYTPEVEKVMIRDMVIDPRTGDRDVFQVAVPGTYYKQELFEIALGERGVDVSGKDKTELHQAQFLADDSLMEFMQYMDSVATREWCTDIVMGEQVSNPSDDVYETFKRESHERQEELVPLAHQLSDFILELHLEGFDRAEAPGHIDVYVRNRILDLAESNIDVATQAFNEETAELFREANELELEGKYKEADARRAFARRNAPSGVCGNNCGIESVSTGGRESLALRSATKAKAGYSVAKDKVRSCTNCGEVALVYSYNSVRVNTRCMACDAFKSKISIMTDAMESSDQNTAIAA